MSAVLIAAFCLHTVIYKKAESSIHASLSFDASFGGVSALKKLFADLPQDLAAAVFIVVLHREPDNDAIWDIKLRLAISYIQGILGTSGYRHERRQIKSKRRLRAGEF